MKMETINLLAAADMAVLQLYECQRARYGSHDQFGDLDELMNIHYRIRWSINGELKKGEEEEVATHTAGIGGIPMARPKLTVEELDRRQRDGKVCPQCKQHRKASEWTKGVGNRDGLHAWCRHCRNTNNRMKKIEWLTKCCHRTPGLLICQCCYKVSDPDCLTFDHIHGGGNKDQRENGYTKLWTELEAGRKSVADFETLCMSCNAMKHKLGKCVHRDPSSAARWWNARRDSQVARVQQENLEIVIEVYSHGAWKCADCRGLVTIHTATLDHIHNDGAQHRREGGRSGEKLHQNLVATFHATGEWPSDLRVLCWNCNVRSAVTKQRTDATRRANGEAVPMKVAVAIVKTLKLRKCGEKGVFGPRQDRAGFDRYPIKDTLMSRSITP